MLIRSLKETKIAELRVSFILGRIRGVKTGWMVG